MLASTKEIVESAAARGKAVGAFNVILLEQAEAFVNAAAESDCPVILQLSQNAVKYHGGQLRPLGLAMIAIAENSTHPVAVHLDHAEDTELCREAIDLGFSSIMYDGSHLPYGDNVETTKMMVREAHSNGVDVEAELGEVGGKNGVHDPRARTEPGEAAQFVADTGVDLLAVAVGSSHAMSSRDAVLDLDLIRQIAGAVSVPLVLHGSSGVSDEGMVAAIHAGMAKINVSTHLNKMLTNSIRAILAENPALSDPRKYVGPASQDMGQEASRLLRMYAL